MSATTVEPESKQLKETIPPWLAIGTTVLVSVPFSLWLGKWNFAVWVSFIVLAEYFTLGAKPSAIKTILPSFAYSALLTGLILAAIPYLDFLPSLVTHGDLAIMLALLVGVSAVVYSMKWFKVLQEGSLPFFSGISMALAVYFSGSFPQVVTGGAAPLWAAVWAVAMGVFGLLLALFNIWFTFPREVK